MADKTIEEKVVNLEATVDTLGKDFAKAKATITELSATVKTYEQRFGALEELATEAVEKTEGIAPAQSLSEKRPPITVTKDKTIYTAKVERLKVVGQEGLQVINLRDLPDAELLEYATSEEFSSKFAKA